MEAIQVFNCLTLQAQPSLSYLNLHLQVEIRDR
jgi:hypothetical protein